MSKSLKLVIVFFAVLIFAATCFIFKFPGLSFGLGSSNSYYAVYMESGEIYFGKLHTFPYLGLSDVYLLIKIQDSNESGSYALKKLKDEQWGPNDFIRINRSKILWLTSLREDGEAMKAIRGGTPAIQGLAPNI